MIIKWFKEIKESKSKKKAIEEKIKNDDYLQRLKNSYEDFSGMSHSSDGTKSKKYLTIYEFERLMNDELKRLTK